MPQKDKLLIPYPVVVEGKYDKIRLSNIIDTQIIVTDGFGVFRKEEKRLLLRRLAAASPLIVLTDSDGGGLVIRNRLRSLIPQDKLINLYIPEVKGREKRKTEDSREGLLGVEGIDTETLYSILEPYAESGEEHTDKGGITRADMYADGLMGGKGSAEKRKRLCVRCSLPQNISTSSLLEALNLLYSLEEYRSIVNQL